MSKVIHFRNTRYYNNAGIYFPECEARTNTQYANMDATRWLISGIKDSVTCKKCQREMQKNYKSSGSYSWR